MAVLRLAALVMVLLGAFVFGAPLQYLARRRGWRLAAHMPVLFSSCLCGILRINIRSHGAPVARAPQLIVANHVSWTDILVLGTSKPLCFLAKHEVASWPVLGRLARLQGTVFVDRQRPGGVRAVNAQMARRMGSGESVVLFAEATTSDGTRVHRFRSSHFAAASDLMHQDPQVSHVVVQPVAIVYARRNGLLLGRMGRADLAWYGEMTMLPHLWSLLCGGPVDCEVVFVQPIAYQRGENRKVITRRAEQSVRQASTAAIGGRLPSLLGNEFAGQPRVSILLNTETA